MTNEQFGRVLGGDSILDRDTFHSRCDCKSDDTACPVPPPTADCGTVNCASCGCATYELNCQVSNALYECEPVPATTVYDIIVTSCVN